MNRDTLQGGTSLARNSAVLALVLVPCLVRLPESVVLSEASLPQKAC